jgi:hypothetical protein
MALGLTNISMTAVYAELASSSSPMAAISTPSKPWALSTLCAVAGQSPWSFYGTGTLGVDSGKNVTWTAPSSTYKLGDFRKYNHGANIPTPPSNFTHAWGPTGITTNITLVSTVPELNVLYINANADYFRYNAYTTTARRIAAATGPPSTNRYDTSEEQWLSNAVSPPTGHTRTQVKQVQPTHVGTFTGFNTSGLSGDQVFYFDMYFADGGSDTRLVNIGATAAAGYVDITLHQKVIPYADNVGTCVSHGSYTGAHIEVNNIASSCTGADVNQTFGSTAYSFYARVVGYSLGAYNLGPSSCTCQIIHYDGDGVIRETKNLGSGINLNSGSKNGVQIASGTYGVLSNTMQYDDYLKFNVTAVSTWGTAYSC